MKKRLFYLLGVVIAMMFVATSCNKKEALEDQIVGKWESTSITLKEYADGELIAEITLPGTTVAYNFTFNADGKGTLGISMEGDEDMMSTTWYVDGEKLVVNPSNAEVSSDPLIFDVLSISSSAMELLFVEDYSNQGINQSEELLLKMKRL